MPNPPRPFRFAHLLPEDVEVWRAYLDRVKLDPTLYEYDVRVGSGRDPGPEFETNIRRGAIQLAQRRIDAVLISVDTITVIEITVSAGLRAIGQLHLYPILYKLTFRPPQPIRPLLVCRALQSNVQPVLHELEIPYVLV